MPESEETLAAYTQECLEVHRDIQTLIGDLELLGAGGEVHYACDFSEIYSYVLPESRSNWMRLFGDRDPTTQRSLDHAAVGTLFFDLSDSVVLLPPYALELETFAGDIVKNAVASVSLDYDRALRDLEGLRTDLEFKELCELVDGVAEAHHEDGGAHRLKGLLERFSGSLIGLARATQRLIPGARLRRLLQHNRFAHSPQYDFPDTELNAGIVDRWFDELVRRRDKSASRTACYLDAVAVATLECSWRTKRSAPRVHLVTRSRHMNALYDEEHRRGLWEHVPFQLVIHPRTLALIEGRGEDAEALVKSTASLKRLGNELGRFVSAYISAEAGDAATAMSAALVRAGIFGQAGADQPTTLLETVREPWRLAANLKSTRYGGLSDDESAEHGGRTVILKVLRTLRDNSQVQEVVREVFGDLLDRIREQHHILSSHVADLQGRTARAVDSKALMVLRSEVHWMPFTLQLSSAEVKSWLERATVGGEPFDVISIGGDNPSPGVEYERLLASAYLFGVWRKWPRAKEACLRALTLASKHPEIHSHEAHFLLGVCCRELAEGAVGYRQSLAEFRKAAQLKRLVRGDDYEDPRYLKEQSVVIFEWNSRTSSGSSGEGPPAIAEAVRLAERALQLARDDHRLLAELHNNLCFYYLEFQPAEWRALARLHYERLKEHLDQQQGPPSPAQVDTLVRAEYRLGLSDDLAALCDRLRPLLRDDSIRVPSRLSVTRLYQEIGGTGVDGDDPNDTD